MDYSLCRKSSLQINISLHGVKETGYVIFITWFCTSVLDLVFEYKNTARPKIMYGPITNHCPVILRITGKVKLESQQIRMGT